MFQLKSKGMKILKIFHLLGVCCWLGGAMAMLLLNINSASANAPGMLYGINFSSHVIDLWIVVFFGVYVCLATGLLYGLFTPWGFFRHIWVSVKWIITAACFMSGCLFLGAWENEMLAMSQSLGEIALQNQDYLLVRKKHFFLSIAQISLLISMLAISVIKPWKKK